MQTCATTMGLSSSPFTASWGAKEHVPAAITRTLLSPCLPHDDKLYHLNCLSERSPPHISRFCPCQYSAVGTRKAAIALSSLAGKAVDYSSKRPFWAVLLSPCLLHFQLHAQFICGPSYCSGNSATGNQPSFMDLLVLENGVPGDTDGRAA